MIFIFYNITITYDICMKNFLPPPPHNTTYVRERVNVSDIVIAEWKVVAFDVNSPQLSELISCFISCRIHLFFIPPRFSVLWTTTTA